jgi:hypothetical protein
MASIHQVNHPGKEFEISHTSKKQSSQDSYFFNGSTVKGIRLWNRNDHYRKFIEINGIYVDSINNAVPKKALLRFWGEYEGHTEFELLNPINNDPYWNNPKAVHRPFYCNQNINNQNTDPFLFGDNFYYAICKKANLKDLCSGDIVLFGSEFGGKLNVKFYLDTLFIIKNSQPSILDDNLYDLDYQESTLKRIGISNCTNGTLPIHTGVCFSDSKKCFSFFPCNSQNSVDNSFGRPIIDTVSLGLRTPGARTGSKSRLLTTEEDINILWKNIAESVLKQGFSLGVKTESLTKLTHLPCQ